MRACGGTCPFFSISLQLRPRLTTINVTTFLVEFNDYNYVEEVFFSFVSTITLPPLYYHQLFAWTLIIDIKSREVIISLPYIILHISFIWTSANTHTSVTECISFCLGNTRNKILIAVAIAAKWFFSAQWLSW